MFSVTPKAAEKLREALEQEGEKYGLRLIARMSCCSGLSYGLFPEKEAQPEDTMITQGGVRLFVDPESLALLEGATLDFISHAEHAQGFTIRNPRLEAQAHECGCHGETAGQSGSCGCGCGCGCGDDCHCQH